MPPRKKNQPTGSDIVSDARRYFGIKYVYGGTNRQTGLDCSGLVLVVCEDVGIKNCPRTSEEQFAWVNRIDARDVGPGDLVFFVGAEIDPPPGHVGIIVAPGKMINAPYTGAVVREDDYSLNATGVNRVLGFGRIPGVAGSSTINTNRTSPQKSNNQNTEIAGAVSALVSWAVILIMFTIIVLALALVLIFLLH